MSKRYTFYPLCFFFFFFFGFVVFEPWLMGLIFVFCEMVKLNLCVLWNRLRYFRICSD
jgi:hypothetical protein